MRCEKKTSSLIISNFLFLVGSNGENSFYLYLYMVTKLRQKFCNKHLTLLKQWTRDILFTIELQGRKKTNRIIKCDKKLYFSFICVVATTHTQELKKGKLISFMVVYRRKAHLIKKNICIMPSSSIIPCYRLVFFFFFFLLANQIFYAHTESNKIEIWH